MIATTGGDVQATIRAPGKIVRPGVWWGIPVQPLDEYKRMNAHMNRLPQMREEIKRLRDELEELRTRINADKEIPIRAFREIRG